MQPFFNLSNKKNCIIVLFIFLQLALVFSLGVYLSPVISPRFNYISNKVIESVPFLVNARDDKLISELNKIDWEKESPEALYSITNKMNTSQRLKEKVLETYLGSSFPSFKKKITLKMLRHNLDKNLFEFAKNLFEKAKDKNEKGDAIGILLGNEDYVQKNQDFIRAGVLNETNEYVLVTLMTGLSRNDIPDPEVSENITSRLQQLTLHPNSILRSAAIQFLAEWDVEGVRFSSSFDRLILEKDQDVRIATIGAISRSQSLPSSSVKKHLLHIIADHTEDRLVVSIARLNLNRFSLDKSEYEVYIASAVKKPIEKEVSM